MEKHKKKRELGQERKRDWRERNTKKNAKEESNGREEGRREGRNETKLTGRKERRGEVRDGRNS